MEHNPGRNSGTQTANAHQILDSMITDDIGQKEPVSVEWDSSNGNFSKVFGFHRTWASLEAYNKGLKINNHPEADFAGVWAWIFQGSEAEKIAIQMRENGNKTPHAAATKEEIVRQLIQYIKVGGLDKGYKISFDKLDDKQKRKRARDFVKQNTPFWGGRKFKGVWNALLINEPSVSGVNFMNFAKTQIADYWCSHNTYGITLEDLGKKLSGSLVEKNGITYGIYFFVNPQEISGALPTHATVKKHAESADKIVVVGCLNGKTAANIKKERENFCKKMENWNQFTKLKTFDEVYFMPQTGIEISKMILSGGWALQKTF
jgi:hypothetical protein